MYSVDLQPRSKYKAFEFGDVSEHLVFPIIYSGLIDVEDSKHGNSSLIGTIY